MLKKNGPLLLACNHPNSFLDGIILDTLFEQPIWSLTRGDVFKKNVIRRLLTSLKLLPVYRTSEGTENLVVNYETFDICKRILSNNGVLLIFSEGKCINEWHLRPLKKGTARLAIKAWEENIPLQVLPVGINYSSFRSFGKNVFINFGEIIHKEDLTFNDSDGQRHQSFNNKLQGELQQLVFEIPKADKQRQRELLAIKPSIVKQIFLSIPALTGWLIHTPLFWPVKKLTWKRTQHNDHYDSVMTGILFIIYPVFLLIVVSVLWFITKSWWVVFLLLILPFTAWSYIQLKQQLDK